MNYLRACGEGQPAIEWPTIGLAVLIYGGWALVTWFHAALPAIVVAMLGAWLIAWHSSLQHEILHGHPTRSQAVNEAIAFLPLMLWVPYERYVTLHRQHHNNEILTDPLEDPESGYVDAARWRRLDLVSRLMIRAQGTLLGRLILGPPWRVAHYLASEFRLLMAGDREVLWAMLLHLAGLVLVVFWLSAICGMSFWFYLLAMVYPATSLIYLRAFAEHRARPLPAERTAIVERAAIMGPLFLYNNLHAAHHERPDLPWYELPAYYRANRDRLVAQNGGLVYDGYLDVARRFLLKPHDTPLHPFFHSDA